MSSVLDHNSNIIIIIVTTFLVIVVSIFVHELGHATVGILMGYTLVDFNVTLSISPLNIVSGYVVLSQEVVHWQVFFAGGLFQSIFLLFARKILEEYKNGVLITFTYAIIETLVGVGML